MPVGHGLRKCVLVTLAVLGLGGCAAFPQAATPRSSLPDLSHAARKPDVYADVHLYRGQPDSNPEAITQGHAKMRDAVKQALTNSGLFHSVSFDDAGRATAEYRLQVDVYESCSQGMNLAAEALTAYTLGLLPVPTTQAFTVKMTITDSSGRALHAAENTDGVRVWLGLWMLPVSSHHTVDAATADTLGNQVRHALAQLYDSGKLAGAYTVPPADASPVVTAQAPLVRSASAIVAPAR